MTRSERQNLVIEKWKQHKCKGTLEASTGFGKTRTALMAMQRVLNKNPSVKIVVIVPTTILKEQWELQLKEWQIPATVLIINSAIQKPFSCDFLCLDEVHRYCSTQNSKIFQLCNPTFILGLTATYERLDQKEKSVLDVYCPIFDSITLEESENNSWAAPYNIYKVTLSVDTTQYVEANQSFLSNFAFFNFDWNLAMGCVTSVKLRQQLAKVSGHPEKVVAGHAFAWKKAMQFRKNFIANHPKKLEIAKLILSKRQHTKAITFNSNIKQCESYGFGYVIHSKRKAKENKQVLQEFYKAGPGSVLHNSKIAKEGYDCPGLSVAILTGFYSDKISMRQIIGRCIRFEPDKKAEIFVLTLQGCQDEKWFQHATQGLSYIELDEKDLHKLLDGKTKIGIKKQQEKFKGLRY